jgi:hypothetical protein
MSVLDTLPPDQRAVLELVLTRGRDYDEIARMLSVDRAGVRQRALAALDALGPQTGAEAPQRALITDYLLGQLPARVAGDVRERLRRDPADRAWARVVAAELSSIANHPLPEIPAAGADDMAAGDHGHAANGTGTAAAPAPAASGAPAATAGQAPATEAGHDGSPGAPTPGSGRAGSPLSGGTRRGSRRGGAILLSVGALIVLGVVLAIVFTSGGSKPHHAPSTHPGTTTGTATGASPQPLATIRMAPPTAGSKVQGIAEAFVESGQRLLAVVALNLTPNHNNYYAVWLTNGSSNELVGYERVAVKSDGRLDALAPIPSNAGNFNRLLLTLEPGTPPTNGPKTPGTVVLQGNWTVK